MAPLRISGVDVEFPFDPYPAQVAYMENVIDALDGGVNALLESPTGTGKTLCLLCACLGWLRRERARLAPQAAALAGTTLFSGSGAAPDGGTKIVYCSRTHAQLAQVARELKRTAYKDDLSVALLGAREHMCVNSEVVRLPTSQAQQRLCSALRADHACRFFRHLQRNPGPFLSEEYRVHDMEDLVREGRLNGFCPYFHERDAAAKADVILMPYNYILDPTLRRQLPFAIDGAILVVDEAHNLPGVLSAAGCFDLMPADLATAIHDCARAAAALRLTEAARDVPPALAGTVTGASSPSEADIEEQELASLKLVLARLETSIAEAPMTLASPQAAQLSTATEQVRPGEALFSFLGKALITRGMYEGTPGATGMNDVISKAITLLTETEHPASGLARVQRFLSAVFEHDPSDYGSTRFVLQELPPDRKHAPGADRLSHESPHAAKATPKRSVGFWVLDNSKNLTELSQAVRSLLLTSGTLSPLDHFAAELGVDFPIRLCGAHVIEAEKQVYGGVLCKGPGGEKLNSSYAFRHSLHYRQSLGMALTSLCRITPGGVLVFFPSYSALHSTVDIWKAGTTDTGNASTLSTRTVWGVLSEIKPIFVEPNNTGELKAVVQSFQKTVDEAPRRGAVLLAVCRGKVSEGVDFADHHGRCVMVTGIPFANHTDLFVRVKKAYLTEVAPQRPRVSGRLFTGDDWYRNEAMRAVNQCVGRVIRHKDDYGAVVLADERFGAHLNELSPWIAARTAVYNDFRGCFASLNGFFAPHRAASRRPRDLGAEDNESVATGTAVAVVVNSGVSAPPDTAEQAKQYALEQERHRLDLENARVRRRLEAVAEQPLAGTPGAAQRASGSSRSGNIGTATEPIELSVASTVSHPPLKMARQQLVPVVTSSVPSVPALGTTSREFCHYLKQHVSVDSYERFKVLLRQIASYRLRLRDSRDSVQRDFQIAVTALRTLFHEADATHHHLIAQQFGRHIPPELQALYRELVQDP